MLEVAGALADHGWAYTHDAYQRRLGPWLKARWTLQRLLVAGIVAAPGLVVLLLASALLEQVGYELLLLLTLSAPAVQRRTGLIVLVVLFGAALVAAIVPAACVLGGLRLAGRGSPFSFVVLSAAIAVGTFLGALGRTIWLLHIDDMRYYAVLRPLAWTFPFAGALLGSLWKNDDRTGASEDSGATTTGHSGRRTTG